MRCALSDEALLELYVLNGGGAYDDLNRNAVAGAMRHVVEAKNAAAAVEVIDWWGCWEDDEDALAWARDYRRLASRRMKDQPPAAPTAHPSSTAPRTAGARPACDEGG